MLFSKHLILREADSNLCPGLNTSFVQLTGFFDVFTFVFYKIICGFGDFFTIEQTWRCLSQGI